MRCGEHLISRMVKPNNTTSCEPEPSLNFILISIKIFASERAIGLRLWQGFAEWHCCRLAPAVMLSSFGAIHNKHRGWLGLGAQQGLQQRFCYIKGMLNPVIVLERTHIKDAENKSNRINDNYPTLYFPLWKHPVLYRAGISTHITSGYNDKPPFG